MDHVGGGARVDPGLGGGRLLDDAAIDDFWSRLLKLRECCDALLEDVLLSQVPRGADAATWARDVLLAERPADTPVIVARNLARDGERVDIMRLADVALDAIDMLTVVIVGNSQSRTLAGQGRAWVYTPRGYAAKMQDKTGS